MGMRLASALALVLCVAAFAGPAFAGNGNGNGNSGGNGNGKADSGTAAAASPGNSASAPGQVKTDDGASSQAVPPTASVVPASSSSAAGQGVKPDSETAHDTHAAASSTKTKLYGNGKTAGEIAIRGGARPSTVLHGPGNSQPHKAAPCSGGHEVDVHALKSRRHGAGCGSAGGPTGSVGAGEEHKGSDPGRSSDPVTRPGESRSAQASTTDPKSTRPRPKRGTKVTGRESAAVLAAVQRPAGATLPFTGFPLWIGVALGAVLLALGLTLSLLAGRETEREAGP